MPFLFKRLYRKPSGSQVRLWKEYESHLLDYVSCPVGKQILISIIGSSLDIFINLILALVFRVRVKKRL